jgi:hypothetical protein
MGTDESFRESRTRRTNAEQGPESEVAELSCAGLFWTLDTLSLSVNCPEPKVRQHFAGIKYNRSKVSFDGPCMTGPGVLRDIFKGDRLPVNRP